ncbi:MAG: hypothetical protein R3F49_21970 [Planctomycetota bacterium]
MLVKIKEGGGDLHCDEEAITRGTGKKAAASPSQGEARHAHRSPGLGVRSAEVGVRGRLEPQRRHLHQGSSIAREGQEDQLRVGRLHPDRDPAARRPVQDHIVQPEYREDWDKFNLWQFRSKTEETVERAYSSQHPAEVTTS